MQYMEMTEDGYTPSFASRQVTKFPLAPSDFVGAWPRLSVIWYGTSPEGDLVCDYV